MAEGGEYTSIADEPASPGPRGFQGYDMAHPFFESDLLLEGFCVACLVVCSDSSNRGMSKQYSLTMFLESPLGRPGERQLSGESRGRQMSADSRPARISNTTE